MRRYLVVLIAVSLAGCGRAYYRQSADRETYAAIGERLGNPHYDLPRVSIDPAVESRLFDPYDPDCPPLPPDDPAAHRYMHWADGRPGYRKWHQNGDAPWIESPLWRDYLPVAKDGDVELNPERSIELGLLHSREYQAALEEVYLTALLLTLDRFQFDLQPFARNGTNYFHSGRGANESNALSTASNLGFTKAFTGGAQLLVEFANTWVWEFKGPNRGVTSSNLVVNLVQPLLRNGGRDFRMERLTQSERAVLYTVRDFARFRKQYSFNVAMRGYLQLLLQLQGIRNQEANLTSLQESLRLHNSQFLGGRVSRVEVEQVFQNVQAARFNLLQGQNQFATALDDFKLTLGLPPRLGVKLDDALLEQFQLNDPDLVSFPNELQEFVAKYHPAQANPELEEIQSAFKQLRTFHVQTVRLATRVGKEIEGWRKQAPTADDDLERLKLLQAEQADLAGKQFPVVQQELEKLAAAIADGIVNLTEGTRKEGLLSLHRRTTDLIDVVDRLATFQAQVRVYLIKLRPIAHKADDAIEYALVHRLDLMNQRARVTDARRQIAVTANALEANVDVSFNANLSTIPGGENPLDFNARASSYRVGVQLDGPLNRQAERNTYRAALVNYQRARRAFMGLDDRIQRDIRLDVRNLDNERLNFEIARQSLISATRQQRAARRRQLVAENIDPVNTINILNAINAVLTARNNLIRSWVNYETGRIQLLLNMELLQLDAQGYFTDEPRHESTRLPTPQSFGPTEQPAKPQP